MQEASRICSECGRERRRRPIPIEASTELAAALVAADRVCPWCLDMKLLAGGVELHGLEDRWSPDELAEMRAKAERLRGERLLSGAARRRARLEKPTDAQGSLT